MSIRRVIIAMAFLGVTVTVVFTGCGGNGDGSETVSNPPTSTAAASTPTHTPEPTQPPQETDTSSSGDAARGQELFASLGCNACHSMGDDTIVGPGLAGLPERAGDRVVGLSANEYIEQSIREPGAFVVDGFNNVMPSTFSNLSNSDLADLTAYLKTLE